MGMAGIANERLAPVAASSPVAAIPVQQYFALLDPRFALGPAPVPLHQSTPLSSEWRPASTALAASPEPQIRLAELDGVPAVATPLELPIVADATPIPTPRATDAQQSPKPAEKPRMADTAVPRRPARIAAATQVAPEDNRSFLEKDLRTTATRSPGPCLCCSAGQHHRQCSRPAPSPAPRLDNSQLEPLTTSLRKPSTCRTARSLKHILDSATDWTTRASSTNACVEQRRRTSMNMTH